MLSSDRLHVHVGENEQYAHELNDAAVDLLGPRVTAGEYPSRTHGRVFHLCRYVAAVVVISADDVKGKACLALQARRREHAFEGVAKCATSERLLLDGESGQPMSK